MNITDFAIKVLKVDEGDVDISVKLTVENFSDDDEVFITVKGLDSDGFEIYNFIINGRVPHGQIKTLTTIENYINEELFSQIENWEFEV